MKRLLMTLLLVPSVAMAQGNDADLKVMRDYVYSSKQTEAAREAALRKLLDAKPAAAKAKEGDGTALSWALDSAGIAGDLGRKARHLAELLVAKGADVNARVGRDPEAMLIKYARFARVEAMEILVKHKANVKVTDADGRTALHWVALLNENSRDPKDPVPAAHVQSYLRALKVLLDGKCPIDAKDKRGVTALAATSFLGNLKMTELLLSRGADVNAKDKDGYSVLGRIKLRQGPKDSFASARERASLPPVIALLQKKGAKDLRPK
jgi:ankyrin repeat protein